MSISKAAPQKVRVRARPNNTPLFSTWLPWDGEVRPGQFWGTREEVEYTRRHWMEHDGVVPKTRVSGVFVVKSISRRVWKEWCHITAAPAYAPLIHEWTQRMEERGVTVPWRGGRIGELRP